MTTNQSIYMTYNHSNFYDHWEIDSCYPLKEVKSDTNKSIDMQMLEIILTVQTENFIEI